MRRRAFGVALAAFVAAGPAAPAQEIGVAAAVNPDAFGTPPGQSERVIRIGLDMLSDERVVTGPNGRTQMLFLDGSALTIGPSSEVVLDEFVFDPETGAGKLALTASKGLFRFVGGKISKGSPVTIRTPTATIGVRGGIAVVEVGAATRAQFLFGDQMTVAAGGQVREVTRPGFEVTAGPNSPPSPPAPLTQQSVAGNMGGLEGVRGSTAGAPERPTDENVAGTQISQLGSVKAPQRVAPAQAGRRGQAQGPARPAQPFGRALERANQLVSVDRSAGIGSGDDRQQLGQGLTAPFSYGGHVFSGMPFLDFDFDTLLANRRPRDNAAFSGGRVRNGFFTATIGDQAVRAPARAGPFLFSAAEATVDGDPIFGNGFFAPDLSFFAYFGQSAVDGKRGMLFGGVPFEPPGDATGFAAFALKPGFPGADHIPFLPFDVGGNFGGASVSPLLARFREPGQPVPANYRSVALYGAVALEGQGAAQRSAMTVYVGNFFEDPALGKLVLSGFANGSVRLGAQALPIRVGQGGTSSPDGEGNSFFGLSQLDYFVLDSDIYPTGMATPRQPAAGFRQSFENTAVGDPFFQTQFAARQPAPSGIGASRMTRTMNGYVGAIADIRTGFVSGVPQFDAATYINDFADPLSVAIGTDAASNRAAASFRLNGTSETLPSVDLEFGGLGGAGARSAFIDDRLIGLRDSATAPSLLDGQSATLSGGLLTSAFFDGRSAIPPGVTLCACEHLTWGLFSADLHSQGPERLRFHFAPFVVGDLPSPSSIPTSGSASYTGHVVANVVNAGARYVAFGSFTQTWDFGQRIGAVNIGNLDGANYAGQISSMNGRDFNGAFSGANGFAYVDGSFFRGGGDPAAASGGSISIGGGQMAPGGYRLGGVFVAGRQ
jgi:hypothetical protein